jgi:hypothetical protein
MRRQQKITAARLNWYGLMKRAWPDDPEIDERLKHYIALYSEMVALDRRKLDELVKAKHPALYEAMRGPQPEVTA